MSLTIKGDAVNKRYIPLMKHPLVLANSIMQQNSAGDTIDVSGSISVNSAGFKVSGTKVIGAQLTTIATAGAMTTSGSNTGTAGSGLSLINSTTSDQSAAIMNDFLALQQDITVLATKFHSILSAIRTHGLIET